MQRPISEKHYILVRIVFELSRHIRQITTFDKWMSLFTLPHLG